PLLLLQFARTHLIYAPFPTRRSSDLAIATRKGSPRHRLGSRAAAAPNHRSWSTAARNCSSPLGPAQDTSRQRAGAISCGGTPRRSEEDTSALPSLTNVV